MVIERRDPAQQHGRPQLPPVHGRALRDDEDSAVPVRVTEEILAALLPPYAARRAGRQAEREQAQPRAEEPQPGLQPPSELLGTWRGHAHTYQADLPLRLEVKADGDVHARLGT